MASIIKRKNYVPKKPTYKITTTSRTRSSNVKRPYNLMFWNVLKKDLSSTVREMAVNHDADIILLGELKRDDVDKYVNELKKNNYVLRTKKNSKVKIFDRLTNIQGTLISPPTEKPQGKRITNLIYEINGEKILIVGLHLYSKAAVKQEETRKGFANEALKIIEEIETGHGIEKTILIGDFNMNPYEQGMTDFFGIHSTMCRNTALKMMKKLGGEKKRHLFNPSWQAYASVGDSVKPAGTLYYDGDPYASRTDYWNLLDQVVISPTLVSNSKEFSIITGINKGQYNLLKDLKPDSDKFSDHLPILYKIEL